MTTPKRTYRRASNARSREIKVRITQARLDELRSIVEQQRQTEPAFSQADFVDRAITMWRAMRSQK